LIANLNQALEDIDNGQTKAAINVLLTFIYQVTNLMDDGEIPAEQATAIIDATYAIIYQLIIDIGDLIIVIRDMVNAGTITHGQGNALITKLDQALKKIDKGQTKVAINVLLTFIDQVTDLMYDGEIPAKQATGIIYATYAIIDQLEIDNKKSYVMNTGVEGPGLQLESALGLIYPNPFGFSTTIHYAVSAENDIPVQVWLRVYNFTGQVVANLVDKKMTSGRYTVEWDGRYDDGLIAPGAVYFIQLSTGNVKQVRKIILLK